MDAIYTNKPAESKVSQVPTGMGVANRKLKLENDEDVRSISFHNVSYMVEQRKCFMKRPPKIILNNVRYACI